ncbi:hypothetical protein [Panacibacter ginsenosidivorans]|nr:hypothetical protein [Panacibacter ginsenosidivorans]
MKNKLLFITLSLKAAAFATIFFITKNETAGSSAEYPFNENIFPGF